VRRPVRSELQHPVSLRLDACGACQPREALGGRQGGLHVLVVRAAAQVAAEDRVRTV